MQIFDLKNIETGSEPAEVFYKDSSFNSRLISLNKGEKIPPCEMDFNLIFIVIEGKVEITADDQKSILTQNQVLISKPGVFSMEALLDVKIMGIQIQAN